MRSPSAAPDRRPLHVLARPAYRNRDKLPYNRLLYDAVRTQGVAVADFATWPLLRRPVDIVHLHWPESLLETRSRLAALRSARAALLRLDLARARGARIVWTVHDREPHDYVFPELERRFFAAVLGRLHGLIGLTQSGLEQIRLDRPLLRPLPGFVIPHGHFRDAYPRLLDQASARRLLGLPADAFVLVFFGQIRPYKNLPALIAAFRALPDPTLRLVIAGRINRRSDCGPAVRAAAAGDPRILLRLGFVPEDEVERHLVAADLVACPFRQILNSGSAILGLSFDRPVLAPRLGALPELQGRVGPAWLRLFDGPLEPATLASAIDWGRAAARGPRPDLESLNWGPIGAATVAAYRSVIETTRRQPPRP